MMTDPTLKFIHEVIYYVPDYRPGAPTALVAEGFVIDAEKGERLTFKHDADVLELREKRKDLPDVVVTITIPHGGYLYRMERQFVRRRTPSDAPAPLLSTRIEGV